MMNDELDVKDLRPDPKNRRKHTEKNLGTIVRALDEVGAGRSIVIDEEGEILAGNATVEAAKRVGLKKVRVVETEGDELIAVRRRGLSEEQKRKLALYDNRAGELAEWSVEQLFEDVKSGLDFEGVFDAKDLLDMGIKVEEEGGGDDPGPQIDRAEELRERWGVESGQLWELGEHRLVCGDCTDREVVEGLRGVGASVQTLHMVGKGVPDLLVGFRGRNYLFEVKNGPGDRFTADELKWHNGWQGEVRVVWDVESALRGIGVWGVIGNDVLASETITKVIDNG